MHVNYVRKYLKLIELDFESFQDLGKIRNLVIFKETFKVDF